jgi:2-methylisocitrate lyase-like PEP mutase family enzyme
MDSKATALRKLMASGEMLLIPGCFDPLGGRLIEELGYKAAYVGGFATGSHLVHTEPLLQLNDQVEVAARIAKVIDIPVLADAHAGWGDALHTVRTVREFEAAGIAGFHIEDQVVPKRASYFKNIIHILPRDEFIQKMKIAVKAKKNPDTVIIGRTDAFAAQGGGRDEAVARAKAMIDIGVDMIFFRGAREIEHYEYFRKQLGDFPQFTVAHGDIPADFFRKLKFNIIVYPTAATIVYYSAMRQLYITLKEKGLGSYTKDEYWETRKLLYQTVDLPAMWELERETVEDIDMPETSLPVTNLKAKRRIAS